MLLHTHTHHTPHTHTHTHTHTHKVTAGNLFPLSEPVLRARGLFMCVFNCTWKGLSVSTSEQTQMLLLEHSHASCFEPTIQPETLSLSVSPSLSVFLSLSPPHSLSLSLSLSLFLCLSPFP